MSSPCRKLLSSYCEELQWTKDEMVSLTESHTDQLKKFALPFLLFTHFCNFKLYFPIPILQKRLCTFTLARVGAFVARECTTLNGLTFQFAVIFLSSYFLSPSLPTPPTYVNHAGGISRHRLTPYNIRSLKYSSWSPGTVRFPISDTYYIRYKPILDRR